MFPEKEGELHLFINALFWYYNFESDLGFFSFFVFLFGLVWFFSFSFQFNEHRVMQVHAFLSEQAQHVFLKAFENLVHHL